MKTKTFKPSHLLYLMLFLLPLVSIHADITTGLVGHWKFDETSGVVASDSSGSNNNGTLQNNPLWTTGKMGGGLQFDGVDDGVTLLSSSPNLSPGTGDFTISMWVRLNELPSANDYLISDSNSSNADSYYIAVITSNRISCAYNDGNTTVSIISPADYLLDKVGVWINYVCVRQGSVVNFYANNSLIGTVSNSSLIDVNTDSSWSPKIGSHITGAGSIFAIVDDVRIYSRALSSGDVGELHTQAGGVVTPPSQPVESPSPISQPTPVLPPVTSPPTSPGLVSALSCSHTDVQNAINSVQDGGTVMVPAGVCTWTQSVNIGTYSYSTKTSTSKSVTLQGAGVDQTIIMDKVVGNNSLNLNIQSGKFIRVTGFTFDGSSTADNYASVYVSGDANNDPAFRIDHSKFNNVTERGVNVSRVYGLIDHNTFVRKLDGANPTLVSLSGDIFERTGNVNDSWARPQDMGSNRAVYMEDNTFIHNINANGPFDAYEGARYVFRYNNVFGNNLGHHGYDSSLRGIVNFEIYNNTFVNASPSGELYKHGIVLEFRSGSGVVFNNTVNRPANATNDKGAYDVFVLLRNYRSNPTIFNVMGGGPCNGTNMNDGNQDSSGYPCKDQIGRSSNQVLSPVYAWNNNFQGIVGGNMEVGEHGSNTITSTYHILPNRDYYNGIQKPGYTPYTYPHPLITGQIPPVYVPPPTHTPQSTTQVTPPTTSSTYSGSNISPSSTTPGSSATEEDPEIARLQALIASLLKQLADLKLSKQGTGSSTTPKLNITRTLYFGMRGTDVSTLQTFLISKGYLTGASATGYFGNLTRQAVQRYQCDKLRICSGSTTTNGYGIVGPKTRGEMGR